MKRLSIPLFSIYTLIVLALALMACEDVIDVDLGEGQEAIVVDAWINTLAEDQVITLSMAQAYFDSSTPAPITDAEVVVVNGEKKYVFAHQGEGKYVWAHDGGVIGTVGDVVSLDISLPEGTLISSTPISRVPAIDSIGVEFREDEVFADDGLYAQFFARDFAGRGDTYWIKTFRNDVFLSKSQELNLAYDAGFDAGTGVDGLIFIPPIRELVNPLDEDLLPTPWEPGDVIRVEIHSISNAAFQFMEIARDQINNGDNGIFSIPLANTRTNVTASNGLNVLGYFNVAAVSVREKIIGD